MTYFTASLEPPVTHNGTILQVAVKNNGSDGQRLIAVFADQEQAELVASVLQQLEYHADRLAAARERASLRTS